MQSQVKVDVREASQTGSARRAAQELAQDCGFDETHVGKVAIAATELGSNLVKHGRGGEILMRPLADGEGGGLELLAVDRGPGMMDPSASLRDGYSTAGSLGTGLGSLVRLANQFDMYSRPGKGTVVMVRFLARTPSPACQLEIGVVCQPMPGEDQCGDDWIMTDQKSRSLFVVADGLGHGPEARKAALIAVDVARRRAAQNPASILDEIHVAARPTRGAAVAVCAIEPETRLCRFAGIGNIACSVLSAGERKQLPSYNGIVGHSVRKIKEFTVSWPVGGLLVMHSDGLVSQWDLGAYPGLAARHPAVVASVLYRDLARGRDDVTVVVARETRAAT